MHSLFSPAVHFLLHAQAFLFYFESLGRKSLIIPTSVDSDALQRKKPHASLQFRRARNETSVCFCATAKKTRRYTSRNGLPSRCHRNSSQISRK